MQESELFPIGRVVRIHGVKGKVEMAYTDGVFMRVDRPVLFFRIDGLPVPCFVEAASVHSKGRALLKLEEVDTASQAEILSDCEVLFPLADVPVGNEEHDDWNFLTGYSVRGLKEGYVGKLALVNVQSANTLLHVATADGREVLLPFHPDLIAELDEQKRTLLLDIPDGLLDLYQ